MRAPLRQGRVGEELEEVLVRVHGDAILGEAADARALGLVVLLLGVVRPVQDVLDVDPAPGGLATNFPLGFRNRNGEIGGGHSVFL